MFKARLTDSNILKKVFDNIKDLVTDANFICTDEGIQMQAMDSSRVALVCLTLLTDGFETYECPRDFTLGINVPTFSKIMKCADSSDSVTLEAEPDGDKLFITFDSPSGNRSSTFELNRITIDEENVQIPELEYTCSVTMPCSQLQHAIRDLSNFGDTCIIQIKESLIEFSVKSTLGSALLSFKNDDSSKKKEEHVVINCNDDIRLMFAIKYLAQFTKTTGISDQVNIFMSAETPINVTFDMGDVGSVNYYLAPKIEDD